MSEGATPKETATATATATPTKPSGAAQAEVVSLRKFDMQWIKDDSVVVMIGKRGTGKSWLVRDLLYHNRDIPFGTVINATELSNSAYSPHVPAAFIQQEYTPALLSKVLSRQKSLLTKMREESAFADIDPRAFLIMDDCMYDDRWVRDVNIRNVFMNGRHFRLFFILALQYCLGIPPVLRTNIDYVFLMRENIYQNKKKLFELFGGMFKSMESFCQVFDACTEDYGCMVLHMGSRSSRLEDMVFWYKAEDHGLKWKTCLDYFWQMQNQGQGPSTVFEDEEDGNGTDRAGRGGRGGRGGAQNVRVQVRKIGG